MDLRFNSFCSNPGFQSLSLCLWFTPVVWRPALLEGNKTPRFLPNFLHLPSWWKKTLSLVSPTDGRSSSQSLQRNRNHIHQMIAWQAAGSSRSVLLLTDWFVMLASSARPASGAPAGGGAVRRPCSPPPASCTTRCELLREDPLRHCVFHNHLIPVRVAEEQRAYPSMHFVHRSGFKELHSSRCSESHQVNKSCDVLKRLRDADFI